MIELCIAAVFFSGIHLGVSGTALRDTLVARVGEKPYLALFALASALGLTALIYLYRVAHVPQVTALIAWRPLASALMLLAFVLIVLGVGSRGPTAVGGESLLEGDGPARGIHRITRHPMLWGFMLWSAVHVALNPQPVNLIFFGTFLLTAAAGTISIDAKRRRKHGEHWLRYEARTSNLPFLALLQGRNRLVLGELSPLMLVIAVAAFAGFALFHGRWFGLPAF